MIKLKSLIIVFIFLLGMNYNYAEDPPAPLAPEQVAPTPTKSTKSSSSSSASATAGGKRVTASTNTKVPVGPTTRAAIFINGNGVKLVIANVDKSSRTIKDVILENDYPIELKSIFDTNSAVSPEKAEELRLRLREIKHLLATYNVKDYTVNVGSLLRKAEGGSKTVVDLSKSSRVPIKKVSQREEAALAFKALKVIKPDFPKAQTLFWYGDNENLTLITIDPSAGTIVFNAPSPIITGKLPFNKDEEEKNKTNADSVTKNVSPLLKQAIEKHNGKVLGAGETFKALLNEGQGVITIEEVQALAANANKAANKFDSPNDAYKALFAASILPYMQDLGIKEIEIAHIDMSHGILLR